MNRPPHDRTEPSRLAAEADAPLDPLPRDPVDARDDLASETATPGETPAGGAESTDASESAQPRGAERDPAPGPQLSPRELLASIYDDLRRTAGHRLSRLSPGQTFQATALVHEAWLRLEHKAEGLPTDRRSFYAAAARAMRDLLVEHARRRGALKRGEGWGRRTSLEPLDVEDGCPPLEDLLALEEALAKLEEVAPAKAELVRMRFFAGLTMMEIAEINGRSLSSVEREWRFARAWLQQKLGSEDEPEA